MKPPRVIPPRPGPARQETILVPIKMPPELRRRFRVAAVSQDMTYAQLIQSWLDADDARAERARRMQAHPLHRPAAAVTP